MKRLFTIFTTVLLAYVFLPHQAMAQSPEGMSYQAVIRNSSNTLITSTDVGMKISILQGSVTGTVVYSETQEPATNANGLVSIEIGDGTVVSGDFSNIDWSDGPFFIKTETDPAGGTTYTITGTSQLLSVPYALYAKTAESTTEPFVETDPLYTTSQAVNITAGDITNLGNLSGNNTGDQDISGIGVNASAIATIQGEQTTQDAAIALNTAKVGLTPAQVTILSNTSGINSGDQDITGIATNASVIATIQGEQTSQDAAITAIESDVATIQGEQTTQDAAIALNTAKVGLTPAQLTLLGNTSGTNTGDQDGSETKVTAGTNVSVTGAGTIASPYVVNASSPSSYSTTNGAQPTIASTSISAGTITEIMQLTLLPAGTYAVFFSCPLRNTSISGIGLNVVWAITANNATPTFPGDGIASSFIPASGWTSDIAFGQAGSTVVTLEATGTIELKITYTGTVASGSVGVAGTARMNAIRL